MLAALDAAIAILLAFATAASVQDAWRLHAHARGELRTCMCREGSGAAALRSGVDREAADASRARGPEKKS